jgi:hypothetical protein
VKPALTAQWVVFGCSEDNRLATNANLFLTGKDGPDPTWGRGRFTAKVFIAAAKRLNPPILETSGDSFEAGRGHATAR